MRRSPWGRKEVPHNDFPTVKVARWVTLVFVAEAGGCLAILAPELIRERLGANPPVAVWVHGVPVGFAGIYFFTVLGVFLTIAASRRRGAPLGTAIALSVLGLAAYEAIYALAFAVASGEPALLIPEPTLPAAGWPAYGTWFLFESVMASLGLVGWKGLGWDRWVGYALVSFLAGLLVWKFALDFQFPPFDDSVAVFLVNTWTEVSGILLWPLALTAHLRGHRSRSSGGGPWWRLRTLLHPTHWIHRPKVPSGGIPGGGNAGDGPGTPAGNSPACGGSPKVPFPSLAI